MQIDIDINISWIGIAHLEGGGVKSGRSVNMQWENWNFTICK